MKTHRNSPCECHYAGTTPSLTPTAVDLDESAWSEFDSSYKRGSPTTFAPNQVIKGWTEAMQLMVEGDKWEMYIPSELAYGNSDRGPKIKAGDVLIFRMELLKIMGNKVSAGGGGGNLTWVLFLFSFVFLVLSFYLYRKYRNRKTAELPPVVAAALELAFGPAGGARARDVETNE